MVYAPILIPTLCRYEHFVRCIESLKKNTWAKYTDVYVALDYPVKESHIKGYDQICGYLTGSFDEFASFTVIKRPYNYGSVKNMSNLREMIFQKYDRFIRTDDDCEFSPNFLEYMDKCLELFENDRNVIGVTGYSYPVNWKVSADCNAFKNLTIFPIWGTGFWKDKFLKMEEEIKKGYIRKNIKCNDETRNKMTQARYLDSLLFAFNYKKNNLMEAFSDVSIGAYIQLERKTVITPVVSKVRNWGFDGSGIYCQNVISDIGINDINNSATYNYQLQPIDTALFFNPAVDENPHFKENKKEINDFDNRNLKDIKKAELKYRLKKSIVSLIGENNYQKLWALRNEK